MGRPSTGRYQLLSSVLYDGAGARWLASARGGFSGTTGLSSVMKTNLGREDSMKS